MDFGVNRKRFPWLITETFGGCNIFAAHKKQLQPLTASDVDNGTKGECVQILASIYVTHKGLRMASTNTDDWSLCEVKCMCIRRAVRPMSVCHEEILVWINLIRNKVRRCRARRTIDDQIKFQRLAGWLP